jgi:predicted ATP-grasp superfamily ATP-dependent carboligase
MEVIVLDGNQRPALAVTRSLGKRGLKVTVGAETLPSLSSSSKYSSHCFSYPLPSTSPDEFIHTLKDFLEKKSEVILLPITDVTLGEVLKKKNEFGVSVKIPFPDFDTYMAASDKVNLMLMAKGLSIPIPRTVFCTDLKDRRAFIEKAKQLGFPVVVKPGRSRIRYEHGWFGTSVRYASDESGLETVLNEEPFHTFPFLIQEKIDGPGIGIFLLMQNGEVLAHFAHRRIREKPPSGGVSVLCESIEPSPVAMAAAAALMKQLKWTGVAMIEFKEDMRDNTPKLMEVNARFWGSLQLAISAGIDFPFLLINMAIGGKMEKSCNYRIGLKSRWELGDLDHLLLRIKGTSRLHLAPNAPKMPCVFKDFILNTLDPHVRNEVFRFNDPKPFAYELKQYIKSLS